MSLSSAFRARRSLLLASGLVAALVTVGDDGVFDFASTLFRPSRGSVWTSAGNDRSADGAFEDIFAAVLLGDALPGEMGACELATAEKSGDRSGPDLVAGLLVSSPESWTCSVACRGDSDGDGACDCCETDDHTRQPSVVMARVDRTRSRSGFTRP